MELNSSSFGVPYNPTAAPEANYLASYSSASGPPQVVIVQAPKLRRSFDGYASQVAMATGVAQVCLGLLSICLGIANPLTCGLYGMIGYGIWAGIIYVISGGFGIASSRKRTSCLIISHMVMSIIGAVTSSVQLSLGVISAYFDYLIPGCYYYYVPNQNRIDVCQSSVKRSFLVLSLVIVFCLPSAYLRHYNTTRKLFQPRLYLPLVFLR